MFPLPGASAVLQFSRLDHATLAHRAAVLPDGKRLSLTSTRLRSPADTADNWNYYVIRTDAVLALQRALQ